MLRFKGKPNCLKEFIAEFVKFYGGDITIKDFFEKVGGK
jgi:hypothetical protein